MKKYLLSSFLFIFLAVVTGGSQAKEASVDNAANPQQALRWAEKISQQLISEFPDPVTMRKSDGGYRWSYVQGVVLLAIQRLEQVDSARLATSKKDYEEYVKKYLDHYIDPQGNIRTLNIDEFNIDSINTGKILFDAYAKSDDSRYLKAMQILRKQLEWQPRTHGGGFWHKRKYPWQIWLDGLYMGSPFYAQYDQKFDDSKNVDDVVLQFKESHQHLLDSKTGLLFHGFDESRTQRWANSETGRSKEFWSRSLGWYAMALVDTLDYIDDKNHAEELLTILRPLFGAIKTQQDKTGLWYQVTNKGDQKGNYLEASSSAMFIYAFAKAERKGYLGEEYRAAAWAGYHGMLNNLITLDKESRYIRLAQVCRSAGLGGEPYRDGSYDYYISADIEENDAHGIGSLLLAFVELSHETK